MKLKKKIRKSKKRGVGGDQLQPGVEDGGTPTEVVAGEELKEEEKTENTQKKEDPMLNTLFMKEE